MSRRARIVRAAVFVGTVALLIVFARMVEWAETWQAIRRASMTLLLAAAVVNLLSLGTRAARWWVFLRPIGVRSYWSALRGAIAGSGLNNLIPMSAGEAARAMLVAQRSGVSRSRVVATVALDRLVEIASYVSLLVAVPLVTVLPGPIMRWGASAKMVLVSLLALVVVLAWSAVQRRRRGAPVVELGQSRIRAAISRFTSSLTELPTPGRLTMAFGISMLSWIGQLAVYHLTARAAGVAVPVLASVAAMVAVNVAFLVQLTPGNVGIFQVIYAMTMAAFGVGRDVSVAVALLIQALQIIPVTALALVIAPRMALRRDDRRDLAAASRGFGD